MGTHSITSGFYCQSFLKILHVSQKPYVLGSFLQHNVYKIAKRQKNRIQHTLLCLPSSARFFTSIYLFNNSPLCNITVLPKTFCHYCIKKVGCNLQSTFDYVLNLPAHARRYLPLAAHRRGIGSPCVREEKLPQSWRTLECHRRAPALAREKHYKLVR